MWECNAKHPCKEGVERRAASSRSHALADSVLFVGGSLDGKRILIPENLRYYLHQPTVGSRDRETYERSLLQGGGERFSVMKLEGMTDADLMRSLIENYSPNIQDHTRNEGSGE